MSPDYARGLEDGVRAALCMLRAREDSMRANDCAAIAVDVVQQLGDDVSELLAERCTARELEAALEAVRARREGRPHARS